MLCADGVRMCQDAAKLLHNCLERSSALAHKLLHEHLGTFLLQPRVLQLLLSSLPAATSRQKLVYCSLCQLLKPGEAPAIPSPISCCTYKAANCMSAHSTHAECMDCGADSQIQTLNTSELAMLQAPQDCSKRKG